MNFYLGPSIEKKCYEVGPDLYEAFSLKTYRDEIFYPSPGECGSGSRKYRMDLKKGIRLSLREGGVRNHRILESGLCTFWEVDRLPSYRRSPETDDRIYNFLVLK